jgi:polar amino acid transport system substrate-binding protein
LDVSPSANSCRTFSEKLLITRKRARYRYTKIIAEESEGGDMISCKIQSRIYHVLMGLVSLCILFACATQEGSLPVYVPASKDILRVGVSTEAPPLVYKQGSDIVGLEPELAKEFGKFLGKSVVFVELDWLDQIPALLESRTDIIMAGMSMTNAREYRIAFSEPYFRTGQIGLIRKQEKRYFPMEGYYGVLNRVPVIKIGVVKGTTGETVTKKHFGMAKEIVTYQTSEEAVAALQKGRYDGYEIDLFINDAPIIHYLAAEKEGELVPLPALLTEEYLAWGVRKSDVELLESANAFVEMMKKEGKLNPIIKRWIPFM